MRYRYSKEVFNWDMISRMNGVVHVKLKDEFLDGYAWQIVLSNGRAISAIHHRGANCGVTTVEIAMLTGEDGDLDYSTPITGDVLGWVTEAELHIYIQWANSLPRICTCIHVDTTN